MAQSDVSPQTACPYSGYYNHPGAYLCGTTHFSLLWIDTGLHEEVVIGSNFLLYHDYGPGWKYMGGEADHTVAPSRLGLFLFHLDTIGVIGTDALRWCSTGNGHGGWTAWRHC
jgi:hypothetical protein